jgi:AAA+ ATPase superfamily predicted ATPase
MRFIGREREVKALEVELEKPSPSLIVAYGRRRVGKSRLLREVAGRRKSVVFQATRVSSAMNLEHFKARIATKLGASPILDAISTWEGTLHFLADLAKERYPRLVVVLDEFPFITDNDPALPSIFQRFWDSGAASEGMLKLVLCGSAIAQMELLAERNPLYGRKTMSLSVKKLSLREAALFFPDYDADEIVRTYAVFGGMPYYLEMCDPNKSLRENVIALLLSETGNLIDEPNALLQTELREPQTYLSILAALSGGCTTLKEIADRLHVETKALGPYLSKLNRLELIRAGRSLDTDEKARNLRFTVNDHLIAFWHRYVGPNLSAIAAGDGSDVYDLVVDRTFSEYMGAAFEDICLDFTRRHAKEIMGVTAQQVGGIWGHADFDIDVAGKLLDGTYFFGECKWRSAPIDRGIVETLRERSSKTSYGRGTSGHQLLLFSRLGFKKDVAELPAIDASIHLIDPERLVFGTTTVPKDEPGDDPADQPADGLRM